MAYGIDWDNKLVGKKRLDNTTDHSPVPSNPSYSYDKLNENTDITSKKALNAETHSKTILSLEDKTSDIIQIVFIQLIFKRRVDFKYFCW